MKILFVCTGNICRSPTAEAVLRHALSGAGKNHFTVHSAGTHGYHVGEAPDPRTIKTAASRGIDMRAQRARAVASDDFYNYDLILALDNGHLAHLKRLRPADATANLSLFLEYAGQGMLDVPDPYYGSPQDFEDTFNLIEAGTQAMLQKLSNPTT